MDLSVAFEWFDTFFDLATDVRTLAERAALESINDHRDTEAAQAALDAANKVLLHEFFFDTEGYYKLQRKEEKITLYIKPGRRYRLKELHIVNLENNGIQILESEINHLRANVLSEQKIQEIINFIIQRNIEEGFRSPKMVLVASKKDNFDKTVNTTIYFDSGLKCVLRDVRVAINGIAPRDKELYEINGFIGRFVNGTYNVSALDKIIEFLKEAYKTKEFEVNEEIVHTEFEHECKLNINILVKTLTHSNRGLVFGFHVDRTKEYFSKFMLGYVGSSFLMEVSSNLDLMYLNTNRFHNTSSASISLAVSHGLGKNMGLIAYGVLNYKIRANLFPYSCMLCVPVLFNFDENKLFCCSGFAALVLMWKQVTDVVKNLPMLPRLTCGLKLHSKFLLGNKHGFGVYFLPKVSLRNYIKSTDILKKASLRLYLKCFLRFGVGYLSAGHTLKMFSFGAKTTLCSSRKNLYDIAFYPGLWFKTSSGLNLYLYFEVTSKTFLVVIKKKYGFIYELTLNLDMINLNKYVTKEDCFPFYGLIWKVDELLKVK